MANQSVVDSSAAANANAINLRASGALGRLNQGDLQAELFESLLKLPAFSMPITPPPAKPDERREEGLFSHSKDSTAKSDTEQEAGSPEEDQEIKLDDGPLSLIQQPAIAICYCREPDRPISETKPAPVPDALDEPITIPPTTEGSKIDLSLQESLSTNANASKQMAKPAMVEGDAKAVPTTLADSQSQGLESDADLNPQVTAGVPEKNPKPRSGRAPVTPEERAASEEAIRSGRAPVEEAIASDSKQANEIEKFQPPTERGLEPINGEGERPSGRRELQLERNRLERNDAKDSVSKAGESPFQSPSGVSTANPQVEKSMVSGAAFPSNMDPLAGMADASQVTNVTTDVPKVAPVIASATLAGPNASSATSEVKPASSNSSVNNVAGIRGPATTTDIRGSRESSLGGSSLTPRQEVRLVQRLLRGFEQLSNGEGQVKLRLHPPELGSLQMTLKMEGQVMTAHLEVENSLAKEALTQNVQQLRDSLSEQGIRIERFEVQVVSDLGQNGLNSDSQTQSNSMGQADQQAREQSQRQRQAQWRSNQIDTGNARSTQETPNVRRTIAGRGLDLTA